jgi:hypothetical protein
MEDAAPAAAEDAFVHRSHSAARFTLKPRQNLPRRPQGHRGRAIDADVLACYMHQPDAHYLPMALREHKGKGGGSERERALPLPAIKPAAAGYVHEPPLEGADDLPEGTAAPTTSKSAPVLPTLSREPRGGRAPSPRAREPKPERPSRGARGRAPAASPLMPSRGSRFGGAGAIVAGARNEVAEAPAASHRRGVSEDKRRASAEHAGAAPKPLHNEKQEVRRHHLDTALPSHCPSLTLPFSHSTFNASAR